MTAATSQTSSSSQMSAEGVLRQLLSLLDGLSSAQDIRVATLQASFDVTLAERSGRYAFAAPLTSAWWLMIEWDPAHAAGPQLSLAFTAADPEANPSMTPICRTDVESLAAALRERGFKRETYRAEHGRVIHEQFTREALSVLVYPRGESDDSPEKAAHACVHRVHVR